MAIASPQPTPQNSDKLHNIRHPKTVASTLIPYICVYLRFNNVRTFAFLFPNIHVHLRSRFSLP